MQSAVCAMMFCLGVLTAPSVRADIINIVDANRGGEDNYFLPTGEDPTERPFYRHWDEDWQWRHEPIDGAIVSARLAISTAAVDPFDGEVDAVYALDGTVWRLIGNLSELDEGHGTTTFTLPPELLDDAAEGLVIRIDIAYGGTCRKVTLYRSTLVGLSQVPAQHVAVGEVPPTVVPIPSSAALLGGALAGLLLLRRRHAR